MVQSSSSESKASIRHADEASDENRFVIYKLGDELYGSKLLSVREVVEVLPTKVVPNTVSFFSGVCNLRGQIVGVIDLRQRFDIEFDAAERPVLLVFDSETGAIAARVDEITSVSTIDPVDVETNANIVSTIPMRYILGIAKWGDRMVTLVDLKSVLSSEDLASVERSKMLLRAE